MGFFDKKVKTSADPEISVSDENASLLPDNKQTISAINIKKTNTILFFSAITMIIVFIVVMVIKQTKRYKNIVKTKSENTQETKITDNIEKVYIPPVLTFDPKEVSLKQNVDEEGAINLSLSVLNNKIKITDIIVNKTVDGLVIDKTDCIKGNIAKDGSCFIGIMWTPKSKTNMSLEILFKYQEMNGDKKVSDKTIAVNLNLEGIKEEEKQEPEKESEPEPEIEPEQEVKEEKQEVAAAPKPEAPAINLKNLANDCKKYASKAYDFAGTFIGWVQGDNRVYSPNCKEIIGKQEDDGIVKSITGQILGQGTNVDSKLAEEKRIELTLPLLEGIIQNESERPKNYKKIMNNRKLIKAETKKPQYGDGENGEDLYRIEDKLEIKKGLLKNKIPFSITSEEQLSSMPKDERYVLRQSKPIPAVLNKAIFLSSATGTSQDITATVERNVFGGDGRTIVIPSGTQLIGVAGAAANGENAGEGAPDPTSTLNAVQKINIVWHRLIRPDGAEFNLGAIGNYSADAQGRGGVPGKNDTGYIQQLFVKPLLYSALPVAMEALFPTTSTLVTRTPRMHAGYNTLNSKGKTAEDIEKLKNDYGYVWNDTEAVRNLTPRDKIKAEVTQNFKSVMNKLIEDSASQMIPFTVPAGTRIQVFLHKDIMLRATEEVKELLEKEGGEEKDKNNPVGFTGSGVDKENNSVINKDTFTTRTNNVDPKKDEPKQESDGDEDEGGEEDSKSDSKDEEEKEEE